MDVIAVDSDPKLDDRFVFETAWFGRKSFVIGDPGRASSALELIIKLLTERKASRAHTRRAVHVVWDTAVPIPEATLQRFAELGRATGFTLLVC